MLSSVFIPWAERGDRFAQLGAFGRWALYTAQRRIYVMKFISNE